MNAVQTVMTDVTKYCVPVVYFFQTFFSCHVLSLYNKM